MTRYRTIVADPPWQYPEGFPRSPGTGRDHRVKPGRIVSRDLPYGGMSVSEIRALPVAALADDDCRLFLWATNKWLPDAFGVADAWGFQYRQTLVWQKATGGPFVASVAPNTAEFLLVCTVGRPERTGAFPSAIVADGAPKEHSRKPECWLDYIEQVSPGPYVELFARRARFGWDYWGDESLGTAVLPEAAA